MTRITLILFMISAVTACNTQKPTAKGTQNAAAKGEKVAKTPSKAAEANAPAADKDAPKTKQDAPPAACGGKTASGQNAQACGGGTPPTTAKPTTGTTTHHGGTFTVKDTVPLSQVMDKAKEFAGKVIKVSARVTKVCKKKGCWFVMAGNEGDGRYVRVKMKDYGFFVPLDCDGKNAVVEGTFNVKEVSEAEGKHLAKDGNEDPNKVKGSKLELTLMATAVDING